MPPAGCKARRFPGPHTKWFLNFQRLYWVRSGQCFTFIFSIFVAGWTSLSKKLSLSAPAPDEVLEGDRVSGVWGLVLRASTWLKATTYFGWLVGQICFRANHETKVVLKSQIPAAGQTWNQKLANHKWQKRGNTIRCKCKWETSVKSCGQRI